MKKLMKHTLYHIALLIIALLYSNEHHGQELLTIQEAGYYCHGKQF